MDVELSRRIEPGWLRGAWTLPNGVSALRLAAVPVFAWLLDVAHEPVAAAALLAGIAGTDWLDGYLARHLGQVSDMGKVLDPLADRVLVIVAVVGSLADGAVPPWLAGVVVLREVAVSLGAIAVAAAGLPRIDVIWIGKAGAFAMMASLPFFILAHGNIIPGHTPSYVAWLAAGIGIVLGWVAGVSYLRRAIAALVAARRERRT